MKIALIGYGKMGKTIEKIAQKKGHQIVAKLQHTPTASDLKNADVAIEFSTPKSAFNNVKTCIEYNIPVICGTTGWTDKISEITNLTQQNNTAFLYASNFSLGVTLFFELNKRVADLMKNQKDYCVRVEEIHHTEKKDAPSGTAISIAEGIMPIYGFEDWKLSYKTEGTHLGIEAKRIPDVPGTHEVIYTSEVDEIMLQHTAFSREGFASGAVIAAEWILGKKGTFTMKDVLGL